ncbi:MAG: hypothetical protein NTW08_06285 [Gammaproteobacteria bacterium]|nr:hypothetical protein [Gammaproteobacteria bacterium]
MPSIETIIADLEKKHPELAPREAEPAVHWLWFYAGKEATAVEVNYLYRGDMNFPETRVFPEDKGFKAGGTELDLGDHVQPKGNKIRNPNSAYISTSTSKDMASIFPIDVKEGFVYLYQINPQPTAINVPEAMHPKNRPDMDYSDMRTYQKMIVPESERAALFEIKSKDVKGAWVVEVRTPLNEGGTPPPRIIHEDIYLSNSNYQAPTGVRAAAIASGILNAATGVAIGIDSAILYKAYQHGKTTGDFNAFFDEGTKIAGAWAGAIAVGSTWARAGAAAGSPLGPIGTLAGGIGGGLAGSYVGYKQGGNIALNAKYGGTPAFAGEKPIDPASSHTNTPPTTEPSPNFSPETSFESLTERVLRESIPILVSPEARERAAESAKQTEPPQSTEQKKPYTPLPGEDYKNRHPTRGTLSNPEDVKNHLEWLRAENAGEHPPTPPQTLGQKLYGDDYKYKHPTRGTLSNPKEVEELMAWHRAKAAAEHPPAARSTPLPDSGIPHQPYVDPRGADVGSDRPFFTDADLKYSRQGTQATLDKHFTQQAKPTVQPPPRTYAREESAVHSRQFADATRNPQPPFTPRPSSNDGLEHTVRSEKFGSTWSENTGITNPYMNTLNRLGVGQTLASQDFDQRCYKPA